MSARYCICGQADWMHPVETIGHECAQFMDVDGPVTLEAFEVWGKRIGAQIERIPHDAKAPDVVRVISGALIVSCTGASVFLLTGGMCLRLPGVYTMRDVLALWRILGGAQGD